MERYHGTVPFLQGEIRLVKLGKILRFCLFGDPFQGIIPESSALILGRGNTAFAAENRIFYLRPGRMPAVSTAYRNILSKQHEPLTSFLLSIIQEPGGNIYPFFEKDIKIRESSGTPEKAGEKISIATVRETPLPAKDMQESR